MRTGCRKLLGEGEPWGNVSLGTLCVTGLLCLLLLLLWWLLLLSLSLLLLLWLLVDSLKKQSFYASLGLAKRQQKLLSSPRFGTLKACLPTFSCFLSGGGSFCSGTGMIMTTTISVLKICVLVIPESRFQKQIRTSHLKPRGHLLIQDLSRLRIEISGT